MKKLILLAAVLAGSLVGYNYFTTGQISLVPGAKLSPTEQKLADLHDEFDRVRKQASQAYRTASIGGIDTTAEIDASTKSLRRIKKSLRELQSRLESDSAERKAQRLTEAIREFEQQFR